MIDIDAVDHIGIRVRDLDAAMEFYRAFGFELMMKASDDAVAILKNSHGGESNLSENAKTENDGKNILMDIGDKYPGYTHVALHVSSIKATMKGLRDNDITITQGPVAFGEDGHVSVFVRDPDRNVIELRGRSEDLSELEGVSAYVPEN